MQLYYSTVCPVPHFEDIIRRLQKFYSLPKRYKQIRRFEQRPLVSARAGNWHELFRKNRLVRIVCCLRQQIYIKKIIGLRGVQFYRNTAPKKKYFACSKDTLTLVLTCVRVNMNLLLYNFNKQTLVSFSKTSTSSLKLKLHSKPYIKMHYLYIKYSYKVIIRKVSILFCFFIIVFIWSKMKFFWQCAYTIHYLFSNKFDD